MNSPGQQQLRVVVVLDKEDEFGDIARAEGRW